MKTIIPLACLLFAVPAAAMELTLEENRGEMGSVGYVDVELIYNKHPDTLRAKEEFEAKLKEKESALSKAKEEIYALKAGLSPLLERRQVLLRRSAEEQAEIDRQAVAQAIEAAAAQTAAASSAPVSVAIDTVSPAFSVTITSSASQLPIPAGINLVSPAGQQAGTLPSIKPGLNTSGQFSAVGGEAAEVVTVGESSVRVTAPQEVAVASFTFQSAPEKSRVNVSSQALVALEFEIAALQDDISKKEAAYKLARKKAEAELTELERKRTEIILGKIYLAMRELAGTESVSVVVDKCNILYGQKAVDLTEKLLNKMLGE